MTPEQLQSKSAEELKDLMLASKRPERDAPAVIARLCDIVTGIEVDLENALAGGEVPAQLDAITVDAAPAPLPELTSSMVEAESPAPPQVD